MIILMKNINCYQCYRTQNIKIQTETYTHIADRGDRLHFA